MPKQLKISIGQCTSKGRKPLNQDCHGFYQPDEPALDTKGIAVAIADGISTSSVSQEASETATKSFLNDYYCTSDSWSVKDSVKRVLLATNSWLYAQSRRSQYRYNKDKGYVCTFTGIVFKSATAHLFHVGDSRVYHLSGSGLEPLTEEHRVWASADKSYLSRAMGMNQQLDIDYRTVALEEGDLFLLMTDGIYEFVSENVMKTMILDHADDLDYAAEKIVEEAYQQGSDDNLTVQIARIDNLPDRQADEVYQQLTALPFPPRLEPRMLFDGYEIIRDVYISSRSHVVLARDRETDTRVIIKTPSVELRGDSGYLERFLMEDWIAKRLDNAHVLKAYVEPRKRNFFYIVTEFIEGQTLAQWMIDNPKPDVETVRIIVEQIATGLQAFHRQEMLHQDLRPNNIMIDNSGTVKIIDFGSTRVAGLEEIEHNPANQRAMLGTAQFAAPEYFLGEYGTKRSDLYSLAVITYQMLSGKMPYGAEVAKSRTRAAQRKLSYRSVLSEEREIPAWIDEALRKALHPDPYKRYGELSEFTFDLRQPNSAFLGKSQPPLIERNPVLFWQCVSLTLFLVIIYMGLNR